MNLHRTLGKPDWHDTALTDRTALQHVAASTGGFLTLGNIISVIGLVLVFIGCGLIIHQHYWLGGGLIVLGRLLDLADGFVADKTRTKGPVGELVDASFDKFGTLAALITFFIAEIVAWPLLIALLAPQVIITAISFYKKARQQQLHPSLVGKLSMAALWAALAILLIAKATDIMGIIVAGILLSAIAFALGAIATVQYAFQQSK